MEHPITPPLELVQQWSDIKPMEDAVVQNWVKIATKAARWGWDQRGATTEAELQQARDEELAACAQWVEANFGQLPTHNLHQFRRPKPPSLKEQALRELDDIYNDEKIDGHAYRTIFQALEALPND